MIRALAFALALAAAALLGATGGSAAPAQTVKLSGTVGPEFSIVLRDAQGNRVTKLDPGVYAIEVEDLSSEHNFHLDGPGVDERTEIGFTGVVSWTVAFQDAVYIYYCEPHFTRMRGTFTVGNPPSTTPPPSPGVVTAKAKLVLTAGPAQVITLKTSAGKAVKRMKRGTYTMTVRDRSVIHNAHVIAPGFNRRTTLPFVGSQKRKVKLSRTGTLRFLCDPHASLGMKGSAKIV